ncbi:MAG: ribonuclease PH [Planctomycetes bacterium]|nr:ribonuclease PH [Planctomycetota bacterium]
MTRHNGRAPRKLRPIKITRHYTKNPAGSVLIQTGETRVLCTACFEEGVPKWREKSGLGWVTAEYDMLPGSTSTRKRRNRERIDGRTQEIQRLIGRCLRSVVDMSLLGQNTIMIDCDVLQADGGTRTASITGGFVALYDAVRFGIKKKLIAKNAIFDHVAAVSVGVVDEKVLLDLNYEEDVAAAVDFNIAMTGRGRFIEIQGTGEEATFTRDELDKMLKFGAGGIRELIGAQKSALRIRK